MDTTEIVPKFQYEKPNLRLLQGIDRLVKGAPDMCGNGSYDLDECTQGSTAEGIGCQNGSVPVLS